MADQSSEYRPYKLRITLPGGAIFDAEGPEETVKSQFADFLAAVRTPIPVAVGIPIPIPVPGPGAPADQPALPREYLDRVFQVDGNDVVSLLAKPKTDRVDADGLVMLLWGFRELLDMERVSALDLMNAARESGLQLERIDRVISANKQYVTVGGAKRGTTYSLNTPGMLYARKLVVELFN